MTIDAIPLPFLILATWVALGLLVTAAWSAIAWVNKREPFPRPTPRTAYYQRWCAICRDPWITEVTGPIDADAGQSCPRCMEEWAALTVIPDDARALTDRKG